MKKCQTCSRVIEDDELCFCKLEKKGMKTEVSMLKRSTIIVKKVCVACSGTGIYTIEEPECPRCFGQGVYLETIPGVEYVQTINLNGVD